MKKTKPKDFLESEIRAELIASQKLFEIKNKELEEITHIAQEASRLKSEFLANVSHELRTPINAILGFSTLLHDGLVDPNSPHHKEFLKDIISSANQLLSLIDDILDLAKIEADKMEFYPENINLPVLLQETYDIFRPTIHTKKISVKIKIEKDLCDIIIDPARLKQVFYNYLSNALKFTSVGGDILIHVYSKGDKSFCLEVNDTGIGIEESSLHKLFVKFQQLDSSEKKSFAGTGLGLALTKRIVEAQGGIVGVESTLGKGSKFFAVLPCVPYHSLELEEKTHDLNKLKIIKKPMILVIEQASQERTVMIDALLEAGYGTITTGNIVQAIQKKHIDNFDAIILDLFLPNMKEWEIIRNLRLKKPAKEAAPIVISAVIEQPLSLGFKIHDFLIKPVKPAKLLAALTWLGVGEKQNKKILVIDNDVAAFKVAENILGKAGYQVICKTNKVSALLVLEQQAPDVVLLDPFLGGMDGFEFLRNYRQTEKGLFTPLIIWTKAKISIKDKKNLKASIQRVILTNDSNSNRILSDFKHYLPPVSKKS